MVSHKVFIFLLTEVPSALFHTNPWSLPWTHLVHDVSSAETNLHNVMSALQLRRAHNESKSYSSLLQFVIPRHVKLLGSTHFIICLKPQDVLELKLP